MQLSPKLLKRLQKREKKLKRLRSRHKRGGINYDLAARINQLEAKQKTELWPLLLEEQPHWQAVAHENQRLLAQEQVLAKVTRESGSTYATYSSQLRGGIRKNGYLYLTTEQNVWLLNIFSQYYRYTTFSGTINGLGLARVAGQGVGLSLFGDRVPQEFKADITKEGGLIMRKTKDYWESHGGYFMKSLVADPFKGNENKRQQFLQNRQRLLKALNDFRKKLLM